MKKIYRTGAVGALLDEYQKALLELKELIKSIPDHMLVWVVNPNSPDGDCQTVQDILSHVINSGYGYAVNIHNLTGPQWTRPAKTFHTEIEPYIRDLDKVFAFTEDIFKDLKDNELEGFDPAKKIITSWGQLYDIEQITEHAIVHILRHRRQIEKIRQEH
ncbi:MAG: DinB family protein, partial [Saprospiraceae bacterium]